MATITSHQMPRHLCIYFLILEKITEDNEVKLRYMHSMMNMRAQVSFELMVIVSALMLLFVILFTVVFGGNINLFQIQNTVTVTNNAQAVAAVINYVYLAGDGASYNFAMSNVQNEENITISDYAVTSKREYVSAGAPLLNANVNVSKIDKKNNIITNNRGEIDI